MTASDEAKKALEGVTPGPWGRVKSDVYPEGECDSWITIGQQNFDAVALIVNEHIKDDAELEANARFIAWAREGVPALLAEIAAMQARAEAAELREKSLLEGNEINRKALVQHNAKHAAEIAAKDAEIARLREAMAPFDRMAGAMFARNWNKDGVAISFVEKDGPIRLTFADFLAVRATLKGDTHE